MTGENYSKHLKFCMFFLLLLLHFFKIRLFLFFLKIFTFILKSSLLLIRTNLFIFLKKIILLKIFFCLYNVFFVEISLHFLMKLHKSFSSIEFKIISSFFFSAYFKILGVWITIFQSIKIIIRTNPSSHTISLLFFFLH